MQSNSIIRNLVVEWAPPTLQTLNGAIFYSALILLAVILMISPKKPDLFEILSFLTFAALGISTSRGIIWFGLVLAPVFAGHVHSLLRRNKTIPFVNKSRDSALMNGIVAGCLLILAIISLPWFKANLPLPSAKADLISRETPIQATEFLMQEELPPEIFHSMSFGSYLIWASQPAYKVFIDPRIELYPLELWKDYLSINNTEEGWESKLEEYGVNTLMLSPAEQAPLISKVRESDQWSSVYKDDSAEIFINHGEDN
jgi:hypothetical protein